MKALRLLALLILSACPAAAQKTDTFDLHRESGSRIEVTSVFSPAPPTGYAPVRVRVTNNTETELNISINSVSRAGMGGYRSSSHTLRSSFSVTAPARKTTDKELLVPMCPLSESRYSQGSLALEIKTPLGTEIMPVESGGLEQAAFAAYSHRLARKNLGDIHSYAEGILSSGRRGESFATSFDSAQLPSDWRGLSGLDAMSISSDEWTALAPGIRTAVLQWVKLGGVLDFYQSAGAPPLEQQGIVLPGVDSSTLDRAPLGAGFVRVKPWNGKELAGDSASGIIGSTFPGQTRRVEASDKMGELSPLYQVLGRKSFAASQVGIILLIFGIIVGPVNLFVFARAGRRHRLFYTTPLISGAAALVLLVVIYFQDGTGGKGPRSSVVYLDAAEHNAFIHQQQFSRTGVLFSSGFTIESPAVLTQAVPPDSRWRRFGSSGREDAQSFSVNDNSYAGDWFQSRAEQAQVLDAVVPTRGRLELKTGGTTPVIVSSLPSTLERLYYKDAAGTCWVSPGKLTTGAEAVLTQVPEEQLKAWVQKELDSTSGEYAGGLRRTLPNSHFFASTTDPASGLVDAGSSIDWKTNHVFLFGPLTANP